MRLEVRDNSFKIELVNNYVHELYSEMSEYTFDLIDLSSEVEEVKREDKQRFKDIKSEYKKTVKRIVELRGEILKELLESNNYEYDHNWWYRRTSVDDINEFILSCVKKDRKEQNQSKKK